MIKEFEFFHGVVFSRILHATQESVQLKPFSPENNSSYILNNQYGLYIKYCTKRMSPWRFTFLKKNLDEIIDLKKITNNLFIIFVCNDDGIVILNNDEFTQVFGYQESDTSQSIKWISVERNKGKMYSVKGSDGKLQFKIGRSDFPSKIWDDK